MKLLFVFPAKAIIEDAPYGARIVNTDTIVFEHRHIYFDTKLHRVRYTHEERNHYWMYILPDLYAPGCMDDNDSVFANRLAGLPQAHVDARLVELRRIAENPAAYASEMAEKIAARMALREKENRKRLDAQQAEETAERSRILLAAETFRTGGMLDWATFEAVCRQFEVHLPIQTVGAGRKRIREIGIDHVRLTGDACPDGVWNAVRALHGVLIGRLRV